MGAEHMLTVDQATHKRHLLSMQAPFDTSAEAIVLQLHALNLLLMPKGMGR